jgi:hypothetical protein
LGRMGEGFSSVWLNTIPYISRYHMPIRPSHMKRSIENIIDRMAISTIWRRIRGHNDREWQDSQILVDWTDVRGIYIE